MRRGAFNDTHPYDCRCRVCSGWYGAQPDGFGLFALVLIVLAIGLGGIVGFFAVLGVLALLGMARG